MAGVSDTENKDIAKQWIDELEPKTVLDIGAGEGTYAKLAKNGNHWTAIEVFAPYINMFGLKELYEEVIVADVRYVDFEKIGDEFDLIIAADMLEHMTKQQAKDVIYDLLDHCKHLLICFPIEHQEQHAGDEGNDFETHIDHWADDEMSDYLESCGNDVKKHLVGDVLAYFLVEGEVL